MGRKGSKTGEADAKKGADRGAKSQEQEPKPQEPKPQGEEQQKQQQEERERDQQQTKKPQFDERLSGERESESLAAVDQGRALRTAAQRGTVSECRALLRAETDVDATDPVDVGFFAVGYDLATGRAGRLELRNLTLTGARLGAIRLDGGDSTFRDCDFVKNGPYRGAYTPLSGAAIATSGKGSLTVVSSTFASNHANRGGAISAVAGQPGAFDVSINDSHFVNNTAECLGAAVEADRARVRVAGSSFEGNSAASRQTPCEGLYGGGAIASFYHSNVSVVGSTFVRGADVAQGANDVYQGDQGASITFECGRSSTGAPFAMKPRSDLSVDQLPPSTQVVHCV